MKRIVALGTMAFCLLFISCGSTPKVERVPEDTVVDLDGYWNDTDVQIVCRSLINECVNSAAVTKYTADHGHVPAVIINKVRNDSDEHIDTTIIEKKFQYAVINSGAMDFVASSSERGAIREERLDQAENANPDTAKAIGNELGADYMLQGSVKSMVQKAGGKTVRTYLVDLELHDIETNKVLWMGENSEIKKIITRNGSSL